MQLNSILCNDNTRSFLGGQWIKWSWLPIGRRVVTFWTMIVTLYLNNLHLFVPFTTNMSISLLSYCFLKACFMSSRFDYLVCLSVIYGQRWQTICWYSYLTLLSLILISNLCEGLCPLFSVLCRLVLCGRMCGRGGILVRWLFIRYIVFAFIFSCLAVGSDWNFLNKVVFSATGRIDVSVCDVIGHFLL